MRVKVEGVVESVSRSGKNGKQVVDLILNQKGEPVKARIVMFNPKEADIPKQDQAVSLEGRLNTSYFNNRIYEKVII